MIETHKNLHPNGTHYAPERSHVFIKVERERIPSTGYLGLFARQNIAKGMVVARGGGLVVTSVSDISKDEKYAVLLAPNLYVAPRDYNQLDDFWYLNHSCNSNIARIGGLVFISKREILIGEQLTIDYAPLIAGESQWSMKCMCGEPACRQIITGNDWKNPSLAQNLWAEWLPHIQKIIQNDNKDS